MKKILFLLLAVWACVSCASTPQPDEKNIYVSILPLRNIVEGIVGDDFRIEVLVPPGASPETFEPTPRQFAELNRAQLIFNVGLIDFENSLLGKIADQGKVIDLSRGIGLLEGSCAHAHAKAGQGQKLEHGQEAGHGLGQEQGPEAGQEQEHEAGQEPGHAHAHGIDPHVWTSPKALQQMARNAYEVIRERYPDSLKYEANYARLQKELQELDARTAEKIARSGVGYFLIYHPALTYYARDYGLRQVAVEEDGKEPSARRLAEIIRQAREDGVRRIFYQSQFPASVVEAIARDIGAECVAIDPLREDVVANIDAITDQIVARE